MLSATACPDNSGKSRFAGKKIIYFLTILALFTSCKEKEVKTQVRQQKVPEEQIDKVLKTDSISINDFGEHKSIHQTEWEEHRKEADTLTINVNPH